MSRVDRWLLPEGIEEVLPEKARRLERMRRRVLDLFHTWGYDLVMPPLIEYLEALLTGVGRELDLRTFKITDQLTGRLMGVRPDMTPQAARIDAHYLKSEAPTRLCYIGPVLRTRPDEFAGSREPLQLGAELFGDNGIDSDIEVLNLMLATLNLIGIPDMHLELGHVGVFRGLAQNAGLTPERETELFNALQRKARPEVAAMVADWGLPAASREHFLGLVALNGDEAVLDEARSRCGGAGDNVVRALEELQTVTDRIKAGRPGMPLFFDLAELSGYGYYTGLVFSVFVPGHGRAVARGGRYDGIGKAFGRGRPATGFGADLRELLALAPVEAEAASGIFAPAAGDAALEETIDRLRAQGERVVRQLGGNPASADALGCDRELELQDGEWVVKERVKDE